jgi:hypothetical protein
VTSCHDKPLASISSHQSRCRYKYITFFSSVMKVLQKWVLSVVDFLKWMLGGKNSQVWMLLQKVDHPPGSRCCTTMQQQLTNSTRLSFKA